MVLEVVANLMKLGPIAVLVQLVNFFQASKRANLVILIHSGTSLVAYIRVEADLTLSAAVNI